VAAPDFAVALFTSLLGRLRRDAPGVSVEWITLRDPMLLELADGQIDLAIAPSELRLPEGVRRREIGALPWRCFARRGHPALGKWGRRAWARWPHAVVRVGDNLASPVHHAAAAAGLSRTIAAWVPHFSAIPPLVRDTDLLATLPAVAMLDAARRYGLEAVPVPFPIEPLPHAMLWSASRGYGPDFIWLRDRLEPIARSRFANPAEA
jgi:DNA-binding transcriptional LysR family regulator